MAQALLGGGGGEPEFPPTWIWDYFEVGSSSSEAGSSAAVS
jgi:hypothetical protein